MKLFTPHPTPPWPTPPMHDPLSPLHDPPHLTWLTPPHPYMTHPTPSFLDPFLWWGGSCRGGWGGSCRGGVGWVMQRVGGVGWVMQRVGGVGCVMHWCSGSCRGGGGVGHVGVRAMSCPWHGGCRHWGPPFGRHAALWLFHLKRGTPHNLVLALGASIRINTAHLIIQISAVRSRVMPSFHPLQ